MHQGESHRAPLEPLDASRDTSPVNTNGTPVNTGGATLAPLGPLWPWLEMAEKALQTRLEGLERELTSVVTRLQALALGKLPATIAVPVPISPYPAPASPLGHHAGFGARGGHVYPRICSEC